MKEDLTGQAFGKLLVTGRSKQGGEKWVAQCACGNVCVKSRSALLVGGHKSCGCKYRTNRKNIVGIKGLAPERIEDAEVTGW